MLFLGEQSSSQLCNWLSLCICLHYLTSQTRFGVVREDHQFVLKLVLILVGPLLRTLKHFFLPQTRMPSDTLLARNLSYLHVQATKTLCLAQGLDFYIAWGAGEQVLMSLFPVCQKIHFHQPHLEFFYSHCHSKSVCWDGSFLGIQRSAESTNSIKCPLSCSHL